MPSTANKQGRGGEVRPARVDGPAGNGGVNRRERTEGSERAEVVYELSLLGGGRLHNAQNPCAFTPAYLNLKRGWEERENRRKVREELAAVPRGGKKRLMSGGR